MIKKHVAPDQTPDSIIVGSSIRHYKKTTGEYFLTATMEANLEARGRGRGGWEWEEEEWEVAVELEGEDVDNEEYSNEIRATLVDHVINHGLTMREAGQRVQPNIFLL